MSTDAIRAYDLREEQVWRHAARHLLTFVELMWPVLEPGTPFLGNWHHVLLCEALEAISAGERRHLVINMPPRSGKSLIVSVLWPVWEWLTDPTRRTLFVSASERLAYRHSADRRRLLEDDRIRARYPRLRLVDGQRSKAECLNVARGSMQAGSVGSALLGRGGTRIILDDPQTLADVDSDTLRAQSTRLFQTTISTRLDDKRHGSIVLVQQRLHVHDLSAVCLAAGFPSVILPAIAPETIQYVTARTGRRITVYAGTPLHAARESLADLDAQRRLMGTFAFNSLYLQHPEDPAQGLFTRAMVRYYDGLPEGRRVYYQSWDLSFKGGPTNDYVVGIVAVQIGAMLYVVNRVKAQLGFGPTMHVIRGLVARYPETQAVLVEDAANGPALIDQLHTEIPGLRPVRPEGGKMARAMALQARMEAGQVLWPTRRASQSDARIACDFVEDQVDTVLGFPRAKHDDDVDALSQLVVYVNSHQVLEPASAIQLPEGWDSPAEQLKEARMERFRTRPRVRMWR